MCGKRMLNLQVPFERMATQEAWAVSEFGGAKLGAIASKVWR
jgi:hypothetical protein